MAHQAAERATLFMDDKLSQILKTRNIPATATRARNGNFCSVEGGCRVIRNASGKVLSVEATGADPLSDQTGGNVEN